MFTTDRIETMYGQLRWNAVFTCPDLGVDEAARSHLNLALWQDSFQRGEIKMGRFPDWFSPFHVTDREEQLLWSGKFFFQDPAEYMAPSIGFFFWYLPYCST